MKKKIELWVEHLIQSIWRIFQMASIAMEQKRT